MSKYFGSITWNQNTITSTECEIDFIIKAKDITEANFKLDNKANEMKNCSKYSNVQIRNLKPFGCLEEL